MKNLVRALILLHLLSDILSGQLSLPRASCSCEYTTSRCQLKGKDSCHRAAIKKPVQMLKRTSPPTFWPQLANYPLDSTVQTCLDERLPNKREDHNQNNWHYYLLVTNTCLGNSKEAEIHTMVRVLKPASVRILTTLMLTRNLPAKQLFLSPFQPN